MVVRRGTAERNAVKLKVGLVERERSGLSAALRESDDHEAGPASWCVYVNEAEGRARSAEGGSLTCHFRQPGLNDGAPRVASSGVAKTYRICWCRDCGARCGRSLDGYVSSGNLSKRRFIGEGKAKMLLRACCG